MRSEITFAEVKLKPSAYVRPTENPQPALPAPLGTERPSCSRPVLRSSSSLARAIAIRSDAAALLGNDRLPPPMHANGARFFDERRGRAHRIRPNTLAHYLFA